MIQLFDLGIGEYDINDVIFNIPSTQDIGRPSQTPCVVG